MKQTALRIATEEGFVDVKGYRDENVEGIAVARLPDDAKMWWGIYHIDSGKRVYSPFRLREDALLGITRIADLTDWTQPASELDTSDLASSVYEMACQIKGTPA